MTILNNKTILFVSLFVLLSGCAANIMNVKNQENEGIEVRPSFLKNDKTPSLSNKNADIVAQENSAEFTRIQKSRVDQDGVTLEIDLSSQFSAEKKYQVSVNALPLNDFLHYVLGDLLEVSYLIEPKVKSNNTPVTLELKEQVNGQRLFQLVQQILNQNKITIGFNENVFYVHPIVAKRNKADIAFGYGRREIDVPAVSSDIIQIIPLKFGTSKNLRVTISNLVNAQVIADSAQGLITVTGKREQILRALSLVHLLDDLRVNNKSVALLSFDYIDSGTFIEKISELLEKENISVKGTATASANIEFVPIEHLGKVIVFAFSEEIIDRVEFWTKQIDKPPTGSEQSFFTYNPRYARASDLGQSIAPLISRSEMPNQPNNIGNLSTEVNRNTPNSTANSTNFQQSVVGDQLSLVVDERSNSLIFYSTGKFYQELLPIIKKLDVMPKQVILEVVIAEVKLTGSFAKGVEFAIQNGSSGSRTESFSFNNDGGFGYSVVGLNGNVNINLNQTDGLINVLSRPTILVRDGVAASFHVGDDIPTVGSTASDPNGERQTTAIQYRTTGIDLQVTPTINAQGTVIMTIQQNISNISPDGLSIGGSPSVFERKLSTEVVAGDGQTVMLGGLISEQKSTNNSAIPLLGDIPLLGHLFRSDSESTDRTELVVLVTPRIIANTEEWQEIQQSFMKGLENIEL